MVVPSQSQRSRGFTLVELLVAIAIISVLITLLLPSLARARENAKTVQCAAKLRNLTSVANTFADEYGYYFVSASPAQVANPVPAALRPVIQSSGWYWWFNAMIDYQNTSSQTGSKFNSNNTGPQFQCPSDFLNASPYVSPTSQPQIVNLGMNSRILGLYDYTNGGYKSSNGSTPSWNAARVRNVPRVLFLDLNVQGGVPYQANEVDNHYAFRHNISSAISNGTVVTMAGMCNVAWVDGHVEAVPGKWNYRVSDGRYSTAASRIPEPRSGTALTNDQKANWDPALDRN